MPQVMNALQAKLLTRLLAAGMVLSLMIWTLPSVWSQETPAQESGTTTPATTPGETPPATSDSLVKQGEAKIDELSKAVDASPEAKEISAGILAPIYQLAELIAHPALHWVAFMLLTTGVVSYGLQLILGKLVVLMRMHISFSEILSDALGLAISLIGLVFTTQAAAENSTFTQSPASVLSATAIGVVLGFIFYLWG